MGEGGGLVVRLVMVGCSASWAATSLLMVMKIAGPITRRRHSGSSHLVPSLSVMASRRTSPMWRRIVSLALPVSVRGHIFA